MGVLLLVGFVGIVLLAGILALQEHQKVSAMSPQERERYLAQQRAELENQQKTLEWGPINAPMICPHCHEKGRIRTKPVKLKKGISGAKATAALLTGGVTMLATGLSRKEDYTQAHCENCSNTWVF